MHNFSSLSFYNNTDLLLFRYVHSYQSYLWNHAASMRVQKHGLRYSTSINYFSVYMLIRMYSWVLRCATDSHTFSLPHIIGFDQVVLGDLVYSKEDYKVKESFVAECEDVNDNNMDDYSNLDEISETDLPEERNIPVKVGIWIIQVQELF